MRRRVGHRGIDRSLHLSISHRVKTKCSSRTYFRAGHRSVIHSFHAVIGTGARIHRVSQRRPLRSPLRRLQFFAEEPIFRVVSKHFAAMLTIQDLNGLHLYNLILTTKATKSIRVSPTEEWKNRFNSDQALPSAHVVLASSALVSGAILQILGAACRLFEKTLNVFFVHLWSISSLFCVSYSSAVYTCHFARLLWIF